MAHEVDGELVFLPSGPDVREGGNMVSLPDEGHGESLQVVGIEASQGEAFFFGVLGAQPLVGDVLELGEEGLDG